MPHQREIHVCRNCRTEAAHRVVRDRVLAPVHWCLRCFHVWHLDPLPDAVQSTVPAGDRTVGTS